MEEQSRETAEEKSRREEMFRVIENIRKTNTKQREGARDQQHNTDRSSRSSQRRNHIQQCKPFQARTGNQLQKYLRATGVRFIKMERAIHVQENGT